MNLVARPHISGCPPALEKRHGDESSASIWARHPSTIALKTVSYHSVKIADGGPVIADGYMVASPGPGLGVPPDMAVLGKLVWMIGIMRGYSTRS